MNIRELINLLEQQVAVYGDHHKVYIDLDVGDDVVDIQTVSYVAEKTEYCPAGFIIS